MGLTSHSSHAMTDRASQLSERRRERSFGRLQLPIASTEEVPTSTELAELRVQYAMLQSKLQTEVAKHQAEMAEL